jgi:hypothetical protein
MPVMSAIEVRTREHFVQFVRDLSQTACDGDPCSSNLGLPRYLEAVSAWTKDIPGYFANEKRPVPEVSWSLFAMILEAAVTDE